MKKKLTVLGIAALGLGLIGRVALAAAKNSIVISGGMSTYRSLTWVARGALLAGVVFLTGTVIQVVLARSAERKMEQRMDALREADRKSKAPLSTESGRFNEEKMRELLRTLFASAPEEVSVYRPRFQAQLDRMNGYQTSLQRLLRDNDVTELPEAEAFLDKVEQNMFGKMRQIYNRLMMYDSTAPIGELTASLDEALTHNERALDQARRLNATVTDYVNNQGSSQESLGSVEVFIKVLQEELT